MQALLGLVLRGERGGLSLRNVAFVPGAASVGRRKDGRAVTCVVYGPIITLRGTIGIQLDPFFSGYLCN